MGANSILNNQIAGIEDLNGDGIINIVNYNLLFSSCRCNATSMASAGINASDQIFVAYATYVEDTINPYPSPLMHSSRITAQASPN
jgi:hypothetical protein